VTTDALHACLQTLLGTPEPLAPLLDMRILVDLERLGGRAFVAELVEQFAIECEALPQALELAAKARDDYAFCALLHALRSAAGNLGASRVFARCLAWRELSAMDLAQDGDCRVAILRDDLAQTIIALRALPG
jgi:two-component system sensor histidine kinase RpfC